MPKTKKFIDKKNAVTFHLVHRSQKDPLAADETAPQRVLVPVVSKNERKPSAETASVAGDVSKRKEEQAKYGILFDDDYNYMQHLRDVDQTLEWELAEDKSNVRIWKAPVAKGISSSCKLKLPSSVFPSEVEEKVGLLNRAAPHSGPRPDLDPDIVCALDGGFDFDDPDNELEDDFVQMANGVPSDDEMGEEESDEDDEHGEGADILCDLDSNSGRFSPVVFDDDNRSRFTEYSMTSSVIRRNAQLSLLDDRFEQLMAGYDDDEMGALDCEEIEGHIDANDSQLLRLAQDFEREKNYGLTLGSEIGAKVRDEVENAVEKYLEQCNNDDGNETSSESDDECEKQQKWDCESILTTYSNLYNHPKLISEPSKSKIRVSQKTGIPLDVLGKPGLTKKYLDQLNEANEKRNKDELAETQSIVSRMSTVSIRPKDETKEDKKQRKQLIREYRKERRIEKKANTLAFKEEKKRQEKQHLNNRSNVQGIKLM